MNFDKAVIRDNIVRLMQKLDVLDDMIMNVRLTMALLTGQINRGCDNVDSNAAFLLSECFKMARMMETFMILHCNTLLREAEDMCLPGAVVHWTDAKEMKENLNEAWLSADDWVRNAVFLIGVSDKCVGALSRFSYLIADQEIRAVKEELVGVTTFLSWL